MNELQILGGGPAGAAAALAALNAGAQPRFIERSHFPRHKVCGEFLSPEILSVLNDLGVHDQFLALRPHRVTRMSITLGSVTKTAVLGEPAFGMSRYAFDQLLWSEAVAQGALAGEGGVHIIATGRPATNGIRGNRLFGFKAHFEGPKDDAVGLFFLDRAYVGVNCVENGMTNVCGLAPESLLKAVNFEPDALTGLNAALRERMKPLNRTMNWMFTGPLEYGQKWQRTDAYLAGDALSFVDPFTGSGVLSAVLTGYLAGTHAALQKGIPEYLEACRSAIGRPFTCSSILRSIAGTAWAERLLPWVPGRLLFQLTRPHTF